ncbi:MAG: zinc ribbon domain-containing protein [Deltaproteobacteria bacterium]|nr:zinc ribbon domain-containing protein [Deltaproteobacteria bacterium]
MNAGAAQLFKRILHSAIGGLAVWLTATGADAQEYEGNWNRVSLNFSVNVESWGDDCGARPRSYSSKAVKPTEIIQNNGHLFFSTGGLRTDRCNSPNPALTTLTTSRSTHMWTRTCETPAGSGRYEKIDYTFSGSGNELTYVAESSFRWSLNEDLCVVSWVERRTWERAGGATESTAEASDESVAADDSPIVKVHKDNSFSKKSDDVIRAECVNPGKVQKLVIAPKKARVSPSESLCFQLRGVDSKGCRLPIVAQWSASQNGINQSHLLNARGCFVAGDNAAESEGVFQITAEYKGITVQSAVEVKYPEIGDLALARIDLSEEIDESDSEVPIETEKRMASVPANPSAAPVLPTAVAPSDSSSDTNWLLWLLIGAIAVFVAITIVLTLVLLRKPRDNASPAAKFTIEPARFQAAAPDAQPSVANFPADSSDGPIDPAGSLVQMICPACGTLYPPDARFCPVDATGLVEKGHPQPSLHSSFPPPKGMICPTCKRGYELGARFCPHDSTALVEYEQWRNGLR